MCHMDREQLLERLPVKRRLFGEMFLLGNLLQTAGDSFYEEITCKQFFFLICLSLFREDPPTLKELSELMGTSHQNVKQIALKLERKGFISILRDKNDHRKLRLAPTEKYREMKVNYFQQEKGFMELLFGDVGQEEAASAYSTMVKIEKNLRRYEEARS